MVLADIDLHIRSGVRRLALSEVQVLRKSSLIQLISRLYDATEGTVKVGGDLTAGLRSGVPEETRWR